jgi:molybdopterin-guanine dinucleotide biosynthesis protein A
MISRPEIRLFGLVLAGGRSIRMGRDKASLIHPDGRPLARRSHDLLREAGCESVVLSLRHDQEIPTGLDEVEVVRDPAEASNGSMVGMISAMRQHPDADWLVVACDLPRLDLRTLAHLISSRARGEAFLAYRSAFDGLPEPLCTFYSAASRAILEQAAALGCRSPQRILVKQNCRLLELVTPHALDNANTPEDWEACTAGPPEWRGKLMEIWISPGNDFRGRHGLGRRDHGILARSEVECVAGMGLRGDRYFGYQPDYKGQVTFLDAELVQAVRDRFSKPDLSSSVFRRNLVVAGVNLAEWVGKRFRFQGVEFEGSEECKPCYWMDAAVAPGAEEFLKPDHRGGLRARILSDGILRLGG